MQVPLHGRALALAAILALLTPAAAFAQTAGVTRSRLPNGLTVVALGEAGVRLLSRDGRTVGEIDQPAAGDEELLPDAADPLQPPGGRPLSSAARPQGLRPLQDLLLERL